MARKLFGLSQKKRFYRIMTGKEVEPVTGNDKINDFEERANVGAGELYLSIENSQKVHIKGQEDDLKKMWGNPSVSSHPKAPSDPVQCLLRLVLGRKAMTPFLP